MSLYAGSCTCASGVEGRGVGWVDEGSARGESRVEGDERVEVEDDSDIPGGDKSRE